MKYNLKIKKNYLPSNLDEMDSILNTYFNNFDIFYRDKKSYWDIKLQKKVYTYCEDMTVGLKLLNIDQTFCDEFYLSSPERCFCLSEAWIPYAWSLFLEKNLETKRLTIIHIDEHSDLMSPFIQLENKIYTNMLSNEVINFNNPASIMRAIDSGAIYIGSMLTPIVLSVQNVIVIHIKQNVKTKIHNMYISTQLDNFIHKESNRVIVNITEKYKNKLGNVYLQTSDYRLIEKFILKDSIIILHIDMDYFNNRYNGSTNWRNEAINNDYSFNEQCKQIDLLCYYISKLKKYNIDCLYIGVSPSFYPVEFWETGISYLIHKLGNSGINVSFFSENLKWVLTS